MGGDRPRNPSGQTGGQQAHGQPARSSQRSDVHPWHGLSVAGDPQGPAATEHDLRLSRPREPRGDAGADPSQALREVWGPGRQVGQSDRRRDRQPERQKRRKRGRSIDPHGYDAGKKVKGKKRHILVDTTGLMLQAIVHAADIQDHDGGAMLLATLFGLYPFLLRLYADGGYQGPAFRTAVKTVLSQVEVEIVKRSDLVKGFVVLPKRWVVERTLAWFNRCRRLAKDCENLNRKARAFLGLASIRLMVRRLCRVGG